MRKWGGLAGWLLVTFAASLLGSLFTDPSWYRELARPSWSPPSWLFAPVWTLLYALMGIAAWMVWYRKGFSAARGALTLYLVQLALNAAWSWIFFGMRAPTAALAEIAVLWILILWTILAFRKHSGVAAALLVPYIAWVTFATALNAAIVMLN